MINREDLIAMLQLMPPGAIVLMVNDEADYVPVRKVRHANLTPRMFASTMSHREVDIAMTAIRLSNVPPVVME